MTQQNRLLEEIKSKTDIVHFISGYVQLKKSGQNWKGLCPFHAEKTPSFMVNPAKQIFHCFGCGAGGDVISFIAKYDNLSFHDALELLAKKAGIPLSAFRKDSRVLQKGEQIRKALSDSTAFFMKHLKSGRARDYLLRRGLSPDSIEHFRLGYAPDEWHGLTKHLRNTGYSDDVIRDAGLAVAGSKGLYDMFRNRVIFPITGQSGQVIAFGGRALDDSQPKYLNSPETLVYKKSETLFGLFSAKEEIVKKGNVLIVEGYMDTIISHQHGFRNVVAPLGTSLTAGQARKLRTLTDTAILVFDGDAAGVAAAKRALIPLCQHDFKTKVLLLPEQDDPDSYLRKHGAEAFLSLTTSARTIPDFLFNVSTKEKTDTVREVLTFIAEIKDLLLADAMLTELADRTRIHEGTLRQQFQKIRGKEGRQIVPEKKTGHPPPNSEEYLLISAVLAEPGQSAKKSSYILSRISSNDLRDTVVFSLLNKLSGLGETSEVARILDNLDEQERLLYTRLSVTPDLDPEYIDKNIEDCLKRIEQKRIHEQLLRSDTSGDPGLSNALLRAKKKLIEGTRP